MPGFAGFTPPAWLTEALNDGLQSTCVYGENVADAAQLRALGNALRDAAPGAILAIDEEGGEVTRLHYLTGSPYPGAAVLGRMNDLDYTAEIGARVGRDILGAGFNLALAPDADVNSNPENPVIGTRSFGADPELASQHTAAWVRGLQQTGAQACPKHFPGHGDTTQDSHLALPVVDVPLSVLEERDLPPFRAAVAAGAPAIMTSHILLPQLDSVNPATLSRKILQGLLREQLGFTGVIVSDALDMRGASGEIGIPEAAVRALRAGCDLLCLGAHTTPDQLREIEDHVIEAISSGRLAASRVQEAQERVRELAAASAVTPSAAALAEAAQQEISELELTRVAESFSGVAVARAWIAAHPEAAVIRVETEANMAVGRVPWGPFAAVEDPLAPTATAVERFLRRDQFTVDDHSPLPWPVSAADSKGVIVIGRDLHRHAFAREGIDALRASKISVLAVETGWPASAPGYADLACYGATRLVGSALLSLIEDSPA
ncbi:hypothetical protein G7068_12410 [Leucobacter viscericola]|uniref:Glycoside hydrolase family 3 N-terminal domain-containing protein n=2 Tax=Leucobacter viscericola TaxID=2714935 RepID=A0A6G7XJW7_9MICO|nr:hypothetical protein G7068_12410 [Leucobacter viscericola]